MKFFVKGFICFIIGMVVCWLCSLFVDKNLSLVIAIIATALSGQLINKK